MSEKRLTREEWTEEMFNSNGNTVFGLPFSGIRSILYEYETKGIHPENRIKEIIYISQLKFLANECLKFTDCEEGCSYESCPHDKLRQFLDESD